MKNYLGLDISQSEIDQMFTDPNNLDFNVDNYLIQIKGSMEKKIGEADGLTDNPLMAYVQTMLDSGSFDNLDVTTLDGIWKALLSPSIW